MAKILVILVIAAIIESIGVAILSGGLKEVHQQFGGGGSGGSEIVRVIKAGVSNGKIILGVALEAVFFGLLLYMLSRRDVSFIWPLTSLGMIFTTVAAGTFLHEKVSVVRWAGVLLIAVGALLTSYSEEVKNSPPPDAASSPLRPQ